MMILLSVFGFIGRLSFSFFSELMGRRNAGGLLGFGAGVLTIVAGQYYDATLFGVSASSPMAVLPLSAPMRRRSGPRTCELRAWARPTALAASARSLARWASP